MRDDQARHVDDPPVAAADEDDDLAHYDSDEDDADDQDEYDFGTETLYEVKCPTCGEVITIDEEMLDIVKFQQSFNAMSRYITTIDEMLDKIINGMGLVGR